MRTTCGALLILVVGLVVGLGPGVSGAQTESPPSEQAGAAVVGDADAEQAEGGAGRTLQDWYELGGWIMHVLVATSILSLYLILERTWALRSRAVIPRAFLGRVRDHTEKQDLGEVLEICSETDNAIARVLRAGLIHFDQGLGPMEAAVETAGEHEGTVLRRNLPLLAAIGNMATMMGLLGTVLGMINSFDLIATTGTGDARVVAGGIFQALVTTAAGLMVGLIAIGFHSFLRRKVEMLEIDLSEKSFRLLEDMWLGRRAGAAPVAVEG